MPGVSLGFIVPQPSFSDPRPAIYGFRRIASCRLSRRLSSACFGSDRKPAIDSFREIASFGLRERLYACVVSDPKSWRRDYNRQGDSDPKPTIDGFRLLPHSHCADKTNTSFRLPFPNREHRASHILDIDIGSEANNRRLSMTCLI